MKRNGPIVLVFVCVVLLFHSQSILYSQVQTGSFKFEGRNRVYEVYLPQNFRDKMPLVISLHGYTETIEWYKTYTLLHEIADTAGFITVYPAAIGKSWNAGLIAPGWPVIDTTVNDVGFISALIDTLKVHYDIDMSRVYCCGFSLGGEMTYKLTGELGHRFAAVASITGLLNDRSATTCKPVRAFPIIHMHGTLDNYETWSGDNSNSWTVPETLNFWLENNGCSIPGDTVSLADIDPGDGCTVEKISYTNCSGEGRLIFYKILNGGHSWPGSAFAWNGEGNKNMDINANVEILNFFKQFENPLVDIAYAKSLEVDPFSIQHQADSLKVMAGLSNPENHTVNVFAFFQGEQSNFLDSIQLFDDGLHGDGDASDNLWGAKIISAEFPEDVYAVGLTTHDLPFNIAIDYHWPSRFITFGPVAFEDYSFTSSDTVPNPGNVLRIAIALKNNGSLATASNIKVNLISLDTLVTIRDNSISFSDIPAGESSPLRNIGPITISKDCLWNTEVTFEVNISSYGNVCWRDTFSILVKEPDITNIEDTREFKTRIYPNPTNDLLTIETDKPGYYSIEITSLNGQQLLIGEMEGTSHQLDPSSFQKGVYLITIRSKDFITTRKIIKL